MAKKKASRALSRGPKVENAIDFTTYDRLTKFASDWATGPFNLVILVGRGGVGKSRAFRDAVGKRALWIEGNSTAFGMYQALYANRNRPVVIDDVDRLWSDKQCVNMLKLLCNTETTKTVSWNTGAAGADKEVPKSFETTSRVALICNDWTKLNENVGALEDRGQLVRFDPSPVEVHAKAADFFWDQDLYDDIGRHLHLIPGVTLRTYHKASQWKATGENWLETLQQEGYNHDTVKMIEVLADESLTAKEKQVRYCELTGASRATYFNRKKKVDALNKKGKKLVVPELKVRKRKAPWETAEAKKSAKPKQASKKKPHTTKAARAAGGPKLRVVGGRKESA